MARRRSGAYRMTPKRRAALKKAQTASARKRSSGRKKAIAAGGVLLAVGAASIFGTRQIQASNRRKDLNRKVSIIQGLRPTASANVQARNMKKLTLANLAKARLRDDIPMYKADTKKSWPYTSKKDAKRANKKLREKGMIG